MANHYVFRKGHVRRRFTRRGYRLSWVNGHMARVGERPKSRQGRQPVIPAASGAA